MAKNEITRTMLSIHSVSLNSIHFYRLYSVKNKGKDFQIDCLHYSYNRYFLSTQNEGAILTETLADKCFPGIGVKRLVVRIQVTVTIYGYHANASFEIW